MEGDPRYFYRRYMDDVIVLAKTRWHLRKAVRAVNQHFHQLKVEQAPDKTFIGKISKGWDFLGYYFDGKQLTVAAKTVEKHVLHYRQLYEQLSNKKATSDKMALALGQYVKRWQRWVAAVLQGIKIDVYEQIPHQQVPIQIERLCWVQGRMTD
jgi:RNA-directed DNA polymerase